MNDTKPTLTRADVERIIRDRERQKNRETANAILDTIESIPVVREVTIGIVSVFSIFR
jgi:hypothetical protein